MKKLAVITFAFLALTMVSGYSAADNSDNDRKEEDLDPKYAIDGSTLTIKAKFLKELSESYDLPPEWPEKILKLLPEKRLDLHFTYIDENKRKITIT